jgi:bifunctional non-homologous end joining protein LigD
MGLEEYRAKRDLGRSREPAGEVKRGEGNLKFVVQKHQSGHLHYDLRLEMDGVLKSWAVPKGPSLKPGEKRLAMMVEDHPLDYASFEGVIPEPDYGAGTVMIWDEGDYTTEEGASRSESEKALAEQLKKEHLSFILHGKKLCGRFALVRLKRAKDENAWLLLKAEDECATDKDILKEDRSAHTGRSMDKIAEEAAKSGEVWASGQRSVEIDLSDAPEGPMPRNVRPMLATLVDEPFDRDGWLFEIKWDGYRAIAEVEPGDVRLYSRNLLSYNERFPAVVEALPRIGARAVLDGELVVLDEKGVSQFQLLQNYLRTRRGTLLYYVFDVLWLDGHDLRDLPLLRRRDILRKALPDLPNIRLSDSIERQGLALFNQASDRGLEGIMGKRGDAPYRAGVRSRDWLKVRTRMRQEMVIGGFTEPRGGRQYFGALVLGVFSGDDLVYTGHAGTGLDERGLAEMYSMLKPLERETSPFKTPPKTNTPAHWVEPEVVAEIGFTGWTEDGIMRHPVILGLREDKPAKSVRLEVPEPAKEVARMPRKRSRKTEKEVVIGSHTLELTNLEKVFWPDEGYTKGDLISYYRDVAEFILPYLRDRPESLNRHPDGITGESFFQKNIAPGQVPDWIDTVTIADREREIINYLICRDEAALVYLANWGCIELNPWNSRLDSLDNPDYLVIDLDPQDIAFSGVIEVAQATREVLDEAGNEAYCKTSGATGLHIYIPLGANYSYDQAREFGRIIAYLTQRKVPRISSTERLPIRRRSKVYIDHLQNTRGQTVAAAYCVRPFPGATVSTPLKWEEVGPRLDPSKFTIKTMSRRLELMGDIFKPVLGRGIDLSAALDRLSTGMAA